MRRITLWNSVPAQMQMLANYLETEPSLDLPSLRLGLLSGDWIPLALPDQIRGRLPALELVSLGKKRWDTERPLRLAGEAVIGHGEQPEASRQNNGKDGHGYQRLYQGGTLFGTTEFTPAAFHWTRTMPVRLTVSTRRAPLRPSRVRVVGVALVPRGLNDSNIPPVE